MREEVKYRILVISMFVVLLMFGIYVGFNLGDKKGAQEVAETVINKEDEEVKIYPQVDSKKKYDIELIYEDYYTVCNETISNSEIIYGTTLDDLKDTEIQKQKKAQDEYEIKEETNERLVFYRKFEQNCPNHFNVKLENGMIIVYTVVNEGVTTVYQQIDISQELIRPEMIEELNIGIKIDSKEELNLLIEDIES